MGTAGRIRQVMQEHGWSLADLGNLAGVSKQAVAKWLDGGKVSGDSALELERTANISHRWLLYGKGPQYIRLGDAARRLQDRIDRLTPEEAERALVLLDLAMPADKPQHTE